ncbi:MAG: hypothetical protein M3341_03570 [Actinomycetota bacterium]|jgi:hypothetical protein|nr:hypothetical protein [Actinomycetota bacterium]
MDRIEDNGSGVLPLYPGTAPGDVFEARFARELAETERLSRENRRLMDELLGGEG